MQNTGSLHLKDLTNITKPSETEMHKVMDWVKV